MTKAKKPLTKPPVRPQTTPGTPSQAKPPISKPAAGEADAGKPGVPKPTAGAYAPPPPPEAFPSPASSSAAAQDNPSSCNTLLHDLFAQQTRVMLDRTDLDEEQKQSILVAMSCPCCGAGAMSFTAKLKRRS